MMRLFPHDDPAHRTSFELLPWYANGSLAASELARVEAHVAECVACKRELQQLRGLREVLLDEEDMPAQHGLKLLMERIDQQDGHSRKGGLFSVLRGSPGSPRGRSAARWAALAAVLVAMVVPMAAPIFTQTNYRTLSSPPAAAGAADVLVIFDPARPERDIRDQLRAVHANIVEGPTAEGVYSLALAGHDRDAAIRRLRGSGTVLLAAPAYRAAGK